MNGHDVFISYAGHPDDAKVVDELLPALKREGLKVWRDAERNRRRGRFTDATGSAIADSQYVLLCISKSYIRTKRCTEETRATVALASDTIPTDVQPHILPLVLHGDVVARDSLPIPADVVHRQYVGNPDDIVGVVLSLGNKVTKKSKEKWAAPLLTWDNYDTCKSRLPKKLKEKIFECARALIPELQTHRRKHERKLDVRRDKSREFRNKSQPAWVRLSTTASATGYRLIVGFRDGRPCSYRKRKDAHGIGCFHCGFYAGAGGKKKANTAQLIHQLHGAFRTGFGYGKDFDVIEFLGDGSFLNDDEYGEDAKDSIFEFIARIPYMRRVLIESRPEHVTSQREEVVDRLKKLRGDQTLEIGIGLETADDFIRYVCLNKGFDKNAFENAVEMVSEINESHNDRCSIVAYVFIKPPFLTTEESIKDVIETLVYLQRQSKRFGVNITPKLEPAAVADGTLISLLYRQGDEKATKYTPLNYWTVVEVLTRAYVDPRCRHIFPRIRVGGREDMDDVIKMPAVYGKGGRYDQFDFSLYDAVQQFNQHGDILKLYAAINNAYGGGLGQLMDAENGAFAVWERNEISKKESSIRMFARKQRDSITAIEHSYTSRSEEEFREVTYCALDKLEGCHFDTSYMCEIGEVLASDRTYPYKEDTKNRVGEIMSKCFHQNNWTLFEIKVLDIAREPERLMRVFFEATDFISGRTFVLWAGVPPDPTLKSSRLLAETISARVQEMVPSVFRSQLPKSEKQLNDLINAVVKEDDGEYRREFPVTRFALASVVPDHEFKDYNLLVESKYIRKSTKPRTASKGIAEAITRFPEDSFILFVVYDPHGAIGNDATFRRDIENKRDCLVTIVGNR